MDQFGPTAVIRLEALLSMPPFQFHRTGPLTFIQSRPVRLRSLSPVSQHLRLQMEVYHAVDESRKCELELSAKINSIRSNEKNSFSHRRSTQEAPHFASNAEGPANKSLRLNGALRQRGQGRSATALSSDVPARIARVCQQGITG